MAHPSGLGVSLTLLGRRPLEGCPVPSYRAFARAGLGPVLGAALPQASFRVPCLYPLSAHHLSVERGLRGSKLQERIGL